MPKSAHTPEYEVLQFVLRKLRLDKDMSQRNLAQLLDTPQSFVSKYENGERRLDLVELDQVCTALGISLVNLVALYKAALDEAKS